VAATALILYVVYLLLTFAARIALQVRRTGSTGFRGVGGRPGSAEWIAGVGFAVTVLAGAAAPLLVLIGAVEPIDALDTTLVHVAGLVLSIAGITATFYAQVAMGESWRIGVDESERTELVTSGPFALVRNPIFAAMLPTMLGLAMLVPTWVGIVAFAGLLAILELQVRVVEEPHLLGAHGGAYASYAARVGRFMPGIGRLHRAG
jgi:protein-S-isoprenylcysteine O-methyltransferase Ste14